MPADFCEHTQLFDWRIYIPITLLLVLPLLGYVLFGAKHLNIAVRVTAVVIMLLGASILWLSQLSLCINSQGVAYRYMPLQFFMQELPWEEINKAYCRTHYAPAEYGGWGPQGAGRDKSYTFPGRYGIQLVLFNGKRILISVKDPEVACKALKHFLENKQQKKLALTLP